KDGAGRAYGDYLHEGLYLDPVCRDLEALLDSSQARVAGDVRVRLRARGFEVLGVRSPHALMRGAAKYGEESSLWDGRDAEGFAKLYGLTSRLAEERP
ncbi:MAG: argininosuccinate synthase, partial [Planctomycetota bacterium]|nr:argininosuccinate synthase [Planctomycetota bacterium]